MSTNQIGGEHFSAIAASSNKQIKSLERELARKERALAETAALLVLSKKVGAIWGSNEDD
ncbi:MAG: hypothetical protein JZL64_12960 [Ferrovum myxofaciens]|nr:hypothetical protein [Ferrovum myxofaciens]